MGKPVSDPQRLADANETVHATRSRLNYGRGNVAPDNAATGGIAAQRSGAGYELSGANTGQYGTDRLSAAAWALRAGNCDANGAVAARLHAGKLQPGETSRTVGDPDLGHTWAELHTPGKRTVVMDPWGNGPAMEKRDTAWGAADVRRDTVTSDRFNAQNGPQAARDMHAQAFRYAQGADRPLTDQAMRASPRAWPESQTYQQNTPLPSDAFSDKAGAALRRDPTGLQQEIAAVHAGRDAYGLNVGTAAQQAGSIVHSADTLANAPELLPRPPLMRPPGR